ncbi:hypothetical protein K458DRAFT_441999 [Lentithecium fluviatile CBS 122367]|uniref:Prokaryotic-type class I peptide chain release factors domain-containing protein n=1 Tax=Lentithecium fluviatile CBS 122367 TaxID=1168545 RepID=A0A6G1J5A0_9PLEO|nr:hypothetical protein K458DRAFT_441999 [Lentithecium fluviatile CBS 122367]
MHRLRAPALRISLPARIPPAPPAALLRRTASGGRGVSAEELQAARKWLEQLHAETIPRSIGELSFSRSSGPGGQNVNKVNSKATLKVPLDALLQHVPSALHGEIRRSRYVAARTSALIIQADDSRKQNDNAHSCYRRLYEAIVDAGRHAIPGETSAEQAERVEKLYVDRALSRRVLTATRQKSDNERRLKSKKTHSAKKSSRRGRGDD